MFAFLRGVLATKAVDHVELDVNGVGYDVVVSDTVHRRLAVGREVTLITHCHIREDAFTIFGFQLEEERALFRMLLSISGIGPKVALAIVSAMTPAAFGRALADSDVKAFTKVGGVGKKTAQRIVLEMKAKLGQDTELSAILGEADSAEVDEDGDDVMAALLSLGCTPVEAKKAVAHARKTEAKDASDEELVKTALRSLARV